MNSMFKSTVYLMIATIISKILGFIRELALASNYGTSMYSDAYLIASSIPGILFATIGLALGTTFIPIYNEVEENTKFPNGNLFTNNVINIVIIISVILTLLAIIFIKPLVKVFAYGFTGELFNITVNFSKIMIPGIVFMGLSSIVSSFLQIKNNFIIPGLTSVPYSIIIIISIIISSSSNPYILPIGMLLATLSKFLFQIPFLFKLGYKYKIYLNLKDDYVKKMIYLIGPVFIGVAVNQINAIVDRTLASNLAEGTISALNYANRLNDFVIGLFVASISVVVYPMISKLVVTHNKNELNKSIAQSINSVILLVIPVSIGAMVLSKPIVKILFERGAFDKSATDVTATALMFYSIGMIGFGLRDILGKIFYSLQDTKTPMINGAIAMGMNIVLNIILVKVMKHAGIALATSISSIICIVLLFISLKKKIGYFGQDKILKTMIKSLIAAVAMGVITVILYKFLDNMIGTGFIKEAIALFGSVGVGALIYGILIIILKVEEVNIVINMVKRKLNRA